MVASGRWRACFDSDDADDADDVMLIFCAFACGLASYEVTCEKGREYSPGLTLSTPRSGIKTVRTREWERGFVCAPDGGWRACFDRDDADDAVDAGMLIVYAFARGLASNAMTSILSSEAKEPRRPRARCAWGLPDPSRGSGRCVPRGDQARGRGPIAGTNSRSSAGPVTFGIGSDTTPQSSDIERTVVSSWASARINVPAALIRQGRGRPARVRLDHDQRRVQVLGDQAGGGDHAVGDRADRSGTRHRRVAAAALDSGSGQLASGQRDIALVRRFSNSVARPR